MTKNITLKIDEHLLRDVKHRAVDEGVSLSAWVAGHLGKVVRDPADFSATRKRALALMRKGFPLGGRKFRREEAYDRA